MKKLFIILCDIMAVALIAAAVTFFVWAATIVSGQPVPTALKATCKASAVVVVVSVVASYIVWRHGGGMGDDDPEEGDE